MLCCADRLRYTFLISFHRKEWRIGEIARSECRALDRPWSSSIFCSFGWVGRWSEVGEVTLGRAPANLEVLLPLQDSYFRPRLISLTSTKHQLFTSIPKLIGHHPLSSPPPPPPPPPQLHHHHRYLITPSSSSRACRRTTHQLSISAVLKNSFMSPSTVQ
jgi:hypothetical protein